MLKPHETQDFTIRPIEPTDAIKLLNAVQQNRDRLQTDFPNVANGYNSYLEAQNRANDSRKATVDESNPLEVYVATDPNNKVIYGVGTHVRLGARAIALGASLASQGSGITAETAYVAGWAVGEHPQDLAVSALKYLIKASGEETTTVAFIRPENTASQNVAEQAGMRTVKNLRKKTKVISDKRLHIATGLALGHSQQLWIATASNI